MPYTAMKITRESMENQAVALRSKLRRLPGCPKLTRDLQLTENWLKTYSADIWVVVTPLGNVCDGPCGQRKAERLAGEMNEMGNSL